MTREAGFTLVEALAALLVFAIAGALSTGLIISALDGRTRQEAAAERLASMQIVRTLLREDAGQLVMRPYRIEDGALRGPALDQARAAGLGRSETHELVSLTRRGRANPDGAPRSSLHRVAWRVEDGALVRAVWTNPDAPDGAPARRVLAEAVSDVEIAFLYGRAWRPDPVQGRSGETDLPAPRAVRLRYLDDLGRAVEHVAVIQAGAPPS